jgi:ribosomal protein L29
MKSKELNDLRTKDIKELQKLLDKKVAGAVQAKIKTKVSKEKNLKNVKMLKRDISQILTIMSEKRLVQEGIEKKKEPESKV